MLPENSDLYRLLVQNGVGCYGFPGDHCQASSAYDYSPSMMMVLEEEQPQQQQSSFVCSNTTSSSFPLVQLPTASGLLSDHQTTPEERAVAALKNHKEAEKRRRERINSHLNKLRAILPCNSKLDKASLLAKVVERVRELKQQALELSDQVESFPSETDEITVLEASGGDHDDGNERRLIFTASLCCEDRSDLLPEIIEILKSLHLKTVKAEMATLGGRIRNVLVVAAEEDHTVESVHFLQNALKSLLERSNSNSNATDRSKRRRCWD